jgi:hypothetical protein
MAVRPSLICLKPGSSGGAGSARTRAATNVLDHVLNQSVAPGIVVQATEYRCASQKDITSASRNGAAHISHATINATQMRIIPRSKKSFLISIPSATCF